MLDPEVVLELRRTVAHWRRGSIDSLNVVADGIEALLDSWERRGEVLREISDGPHGDDPADAANAMISLARAALERGKP